MDLVATLIGALVVFGFYALFATLEWRTERGYRKTYEKRWHDTSDDLFKLREEHKDLKVIEWAKRSEATALKKALEDLQGQVEQYAKEADGVTQGLSSLRHHQLEVRRKARQLSTRLNRVAAWNAKTKAEKQA